MTKFFNFKKEISIQAVQNDPDFVRTIVAWYYTNILSNKIQALLNITFKILGITLNDLNLITWKQFEEELDLKIFSRGHIQIVNENIINDLINLSGPTAMGSNFQELSNFWNIYNFGELISTNHACRIFVRWKN